MRGISTSSCAKLLLLQALTLVTIPTALAVDLPGPACFTAADSLKLPFEVVMPGTGTSLDATGKFRPSVAYPATNFTSGSNAGYIPNPRPVSTDGLAFQYSYFLWANRCVNIDGNPNCPNHVKLKGNWYRGAYKVMRGGVQREVRPIFTTLAKANACTRIQANFAFGSSDSFLQWQADNNALKLVRYADRAAIFPQNVRDIRFPNGFSDPYFVDMCILERAPMSVADSLVVDYEVWDQRPTSSTTNVITQLATTAHARGKKIHLYLNPIDGWAPSQNGIDQSNLGTLLDAVDAVSFVVASGATNSNAGYDITVRPRIQSPVDSFLRQLNVLRNGGARYVDPKKVFPVVSVFDLRPDEALKIHDIMLQQKFRGLEIWRNGSDMGGSCARVENQALKNLFGLEKTTACKITLAACPASPQKVGTFIDGDANANLREDSCYARAQAYARACQLPRGEAAAATFVRQGVIQGTVTANAD